MRTNVHDEQLIIGVKEKSLLGCGMIARRQHKSIVSILKRDNDMSRPRSQTAHKSMAGSKELMTIKSDAEDM
jgi:hypothetical protein